MYMALIIGNFYKLTFVFGMEKPLTFTAKILDNDDDLYVKFEDKMGKILSYKKDNLVSFEDIYGGENYD